MHFQCWADDLARRAIQFLIRLSQGLGGLGVLAFHSTRLGSAYDTLLN
jgi:hypothetical protein